VVEHHVVPEVVGVDVAWKNVLASELRGHIRIDSALYVRRMQHHKAARVKCDVHLVV